MSVFKFKQFDVHQSSSAMKVGTDAMLLGALIDASGKKKGLDIGSGTGVLSLMVAQKNPSIKILGIEIDPASAEECAFNFGHSSWSERLQCEELDFTTYSCEEKYDLIFSNPPYYQSRLEGKNKRLSIAKHESSLPMTSFVDNCSKLLSPDGELWLIIPYIDLGKWIAEFTEAQLHCIQLIAISGKMNEGPNRAVLTFSFQDQPCAEKSLTVRDAEGTYTEEYKELTKDFHFNQL